MSDSWDALVQAGARLRAAREEWDSALEEARRAAVAARVNGLRVSEIAKALPVTEKAVYGWLKRDAAG